MNPEPSAHLEPRIVTPRESVRLAFKPVCKLLRRFRMAA